MQGAVAAGASSHTRLRPLLLQWLRGGQGNIQHIVEAHTSRNLELFLLVVCVELWGLWKFPLGPLGTWSREARMTLQIQAWFVIHP